MTRARPTPTPMRPPITRRSIGRRPARHRRERRRAQLLALREAGDRLSSAPTNNDLQDPIYQLPTVPDSVEHLEPAAPDTFPLPVWTFAETRPLSPREDLDSRASEWTFTLRPQDPPILLFSTRSLRLADGGVIVEG